MPLKQSSEVQGMGGEELHNRTNDATYNFDLCSIRSSNVHPWSRYWLGMRRQGGRRVGNVTPQLATAQTGVLRECHSNRKLKLIVQ